MRVVAWGLAAVALAYGGIALAGDTVYQRGEFKFAVGPVPAFVQSRAVPAQWDARAPGSTGARWRYWLHDEQIDRRAGRDIDYEEHVYEPVSPELVGEAGKFTIQFNPLYQALTLHRVEVRRAGAWENRLSPASISLARRETDFEKDMSDGTVTALIVLDDIRPGDLIRIGYSVAGSNPVLAGNLADGVGLAWVDPVLDYYVRTLYPPDAGVNVHTGQGAAAPEQHRTPEALEVLEHVHGIDGIRVEDDYPVWYRPYPTLQVALKRSWSDVVAWALPLYPANPPLPAELEARIAAWQKIPDPYQRVMAALIAVQEEVRYFGVEMGDNTHRPSPPGETWSRRYGDCKDKAYLLVSVLRRMGFDAVPALVSTDHGRGIADFTPAASVFNHVISRVKIAGDYYWLDATATQQRGDPRNLDSAAYGVALPVAAGVRALQPILAPSLAHKGREVSERFIPAADGKSVDLIVSNTLHGEIANKMRRDLLADGTERISRRFADFYRKRYGELEVVEELSSKDDTATNVLELTEHYRLKDAWKPGSASSRALDVYAEGISGGASLPASLSRQGPLALDGPESFRHEIRLDLPEGWTWNGQAAVEQEDNPAFRYSSKVSRDGRTVILEQRLEVTRDFVAAAELPEYFRQMRKVNDDMSLRVFVQPPPELHRSDRDQRLRDLLKGAIQSSDGAEH